MHRTTHTPEAPEIASYHWAVGHNARNATHFFTDWDEFVRTVVDPIGECHAMIAS
jgi:hypothetical protein